MSIQAALEAIGKFAVNKPTTRKYTATKRLQTVSRLYVPKVSEDIDVAALYDSIKSICDGNVPEGLTPEATAQLAADIKIVDLYITKRTDGAVSAFLMLKDVDAKAA